MRPPFLFVASSANLTLGVVPESGDDTGARYQALKYAICVVVASSLPFGDHSSAF